MTSLFDTDSASGGDRVAAVMNAIASLAKRPPAGHLDGLRSAGSDALTPPWQTFFEKALAALPANERSLQALLGELEQSQASLTRKVADNGITYNLYSDALAGQARPWSLDLLPMIIDQAQWAQIERGVSQRAELLNRILADVYGEQMLVREGMLPTALVHGHPAYLRPAHGIAPRGNTF